MPLSAPHLGVATVSRYARNTAEERLADRLGPAATPWRPAAAGTRVRQWDRGAAAELSRISSSGATRMLRALRSG
jgi:hypothetical protein